MLRFLCVAVLGALLFAADGDAPYPTKPKGCIKPGTGWTTHCPKSRCVVFNGRRYCK